MHGAAAPHAREPGPISQDRCPGVLRLHAAADGSLARVRLPGGRVSPSGLRAIARLAGRGNGLVELTSRGSVQVRGLAAGDAAWAADVLFGAGLLPSVAHDRVRNVLAPPVDLRRRSGVASSFDVDGVVRGLDSALCGDAALAELPGRFLLAVDDGGLAPGHGADVVLGPDLSLSLGGVPTSLVADADEPWRLMLDAARAFLALSGGAWRIADVDDGPARVAEALGGACVSPDPRISRNEGHGTAGVGVLTQADGRCALTALAPLGRIDAGALEPLAALAARTGADARVGTDRTITLVDVEASGADAAGAELTALGLVLDHASGWTGLTACAGLGACASALVDVRAAAATRAAVRSGAAYVSSGPHADPRSDGREHWTACDRGCGAPAAGTAVVVRAQDDGTLTVDRPGLPTLVAPGVPAALDLLATAGGDA